MYLNFLIWSGALKGVCGQGLSGYLRGFGYFYWFFTHTHTHTSIPDYMTYSSQAPILLALSMNLDQIIFYLYDHIPDYISPTGGDMVQPTTIYNKACKIIS
jgi:hypothetical protein